MAFLRPPHTSDTITLERGPRKAGTTGGIEHFGVRLVDKGQLDRAIQEVEPAGGRLVERRMHAAGRPSMPVSDNDELLGRRRCPNRLVGGH